MHVQTKLADMLIISAVLEEYVDIASRMSVFLLWGGFLDALRGRSSMRTSSWRRLRSGGDIRRVTTKAGWRGRKVNCGRLILKCGEGIRVVIGWRLMLATTAR